MLLLFVIGAAGVGGYLYIKMKGVKPASRKNQPDPDADYSSEIRSAVLLVHGEKAHSRYFSETAYSKLTEDNKEFRDFLAELQANPVSTHIEKPERYDKIKPSQPFAQSQEKPKGCYKAIQVEDIFQCQP